MAIVNIRDIPVKFPFTPYDIQKNYMTKVIECLETQQNGILESPTGTGKTLSLLCASLAWLENRQQQHKEQLKKNLLENFEDNHDSICSMLMLPPKIIYSSRTHTQLHQAMQEMKRTSYKHMKATILGSREQMCIDEEVIEEKNNSLKVNICRTKVKRGKCCYYKRVERQRGTQTLSNLSIVDIEDIVRLGRADGFCPYYMARELKYQADVIFMPYNYLFDPRTMKTIGDDFQEHIVIFDEAHNIEKVCEESVSVQIKSGDIETAIEDVQAIHDLIQSGKKLDVEEVSFTPDKLISLITQLNKFKEQIEKIKLVELALEGTVFDGDYIFHILENSGISDNNYSGVLNVLENVMDFLASTKHIQRSGYTLQLFNDLLFVAFYKSGPEYRQKIKECFKIQISKEQTERFYMGRFTQFSQRVKENFRVLNFWCFCPGFGMNMLMGRNIHCVILTSGTLAPLKPLISELELEIGVKLENPHIVKGDQVCVKILSAGPDKELLNSNFKNRNNPKYIQSLGLVISNLIRIIPDGVLIFFSSYTIMDKSIEHWRNSGIWDAINRIKPIYIEPKDKTLFHTAMEQYYSKIQDPSYSGAIFMAVCRGKVSEGLDFTDINGRAVFIIGLPYPPLKEPKVILKKKYLDIRHAKDTEYLKGDDWYSLEATRAVNQAIGRVIRHKDDFGAIILLDSRFAHPKVRNNLSLWLRRHITDMKNFGEIIRNVRGFFQKAQEMSPLKELAIEELTEMEASTSTENLVKIHSRKSQFTDSPPKRPK